MFLLLFFIMGYDIDIDFNCHSDFFILLLYTYN